MPTGAVDREQGVRAGENLAAEPVADGLHDVGPDDRQNRAAGGTAPRADGAEERERGVPLVLVPVGRVPFCCHDRPAGPSSGLRRRRGREAAEGEQAFAKLKALLRQATERTIDGLSTTIGKLLDCFSLVQSQNYIENAGDVRSA